MFKLFLLSLMLTGSALAEGAKDKLVIHEWGTITSYHNPDGSVLGGINTIDVAEDSLPSFVHTLEKTSLLFKPLSKVATTGRNEPTAPINTTGHPDVRMRLETPVIYFYPPKDWNFEKKITLGVSFSGGLLNEFFPDARSMQFGFQDPSAKVVITSESMSNLFWDQFKLLREVGAVPKTDYKVWLAPRKVKAASIIAANGEVERYLFYRGVANLNGLLGTRQQPDDYVEIRSSYLGSSFDENKELVIKDSWILRSVQNKGLIFKKLGALKINKDSHEIITRINKSEIAETSCKSENVPLLRNDLKKALISSGLFQDEAEAMLNTWGESYLGKSGARILYLVPKEWTDKHLPISISESSDLTRVILGRIELKD